MHVEPITCYRPRPDAAAAFSVPHRVSDDPAEARAWAEAREASFAAIACPGAAGPDGGDEGAALERAHDLLAERVADGTLLRDGTPCYYLYRLRRSGRELTGIVAACSVDDCNNGVVRRVEATSRDLEDAHVRHIAATGCQSAPVLLAYRDNPVLEALVEAAKTADPLYDFTDEEATRHSVWRVARPAAVESLRLMLEHVGRAYVVGAHHRAAAAARVCQAMRTEGGERSSGAEAYNYLLCALFPASQVRLLPRHVVVADTAGLDEGELVAALERAGLVVGPRREEPVPPSAGGWGCTRSAPGASSPAAAWARGRRPTPPSRGTGWSPTCSGPARTGARGAPRPWPAPPSSSGPRARAAWRSPSSRPRRERPWPSPTPGARCLRAPRGSSPPRATGSSSDASATAPR